MGTLPVQHAGVEPQLVTPRYDAAAIMGALYGEGITALKGAFPRAMVKELGEDIEVLFQEALKQPGGAIGRGPNRSKMGDISARSALTIHRGTANRSQKSRPTLVLGFDAPDARNGERHDLQLTRGYFETLPEEVRKHLDYRLVNKLETIAQAHTIEGLVMADS